MSIRLGKSLFFFYITFVFYAWAHCNQHTNCTSCTADDGTLGIDPCCWNPSTSTCQVSLLSCPNGSTGVTYNCPTNPPSDFTYTDDFGRDYTLPFIASAYGDFNQAQVCLSNTVPNAQLIAVYNDSNNCSSVLALLPSQNTIVVAFRGAQGSTQFVITALNLILQGPLVTFPPGGKVFAYFSSCFFGIWNAGLGAKLQSLKKDSNYTNYGLWVFGHSLGGALASLTSTYAVHQKIFNSSDVKLITTGQPRTGDLNYAIAHDNFIPHSYRLVNVADLVTKLPEKTNLDATNAFHHHFEIWYNQSMLTGANFKVCKQAEDSTCSSSTTLIQSLSNDYHNTYFNTTVDSWFGNGCV